MWFFSAIVLKYMYRSLLMCFCLCLVPVLITGPSLLEMKFFRNSFPSNTCVFFQFVQGNFAFYVKYTLGLPGQYTYVVAVLLVRLLICMLMEGSNVKYQ